MRFVELTCVQYFFCGGVGEHSECVVFGGRLPSVRRSPFAVGSPWVVVGIREKAPRRYRELCVYWKLVLISVGLLGMRGAGHS